MKQVALSMALTSSLLVSPLSFAKEPVDAKPIAVYRSTVKELGTTLLAELTTALKAGDPVKAIEVCHTTAGQLTDQIAKKTGLTVGRVSLKPRNSNNVPEAWQESVLKQFEARLAKGEDPQKLEYSEVVETDGQSQVRYMKAIPTVELCLTCHGTEIAPAVQEKLKELYPEDKATGFKIGDLRGAFTLTETLAKK